MGTASFGNGYGGSTLVPTAVLSISGAVKVRAGLRHTCAVHATGALSCWGNRFYGQVGNGTQGLSAVPVAVVGTGDGTESCP